MVYSYHRLWSNALKNKVDLGILRKRKFIYTVKEKTSKNTKQQTKIYKKPILQNNV